MVLLSLFVPSVFGQVAGRITGSVLDASGAAVPGAKVEVMLPGGDKAVVSTATNAEGLFNLMGVQPNTYAITVSASGFVTQTFREVKVDPGRELTLAPVKLEVASIASSVDVSAVVQTVQTANAEVSTTVSAEQVSRLPMLDRNPLALIGTQAGVNYTGRGATVINGQRTSFSSVTVDGISVQDNFIRSNGLDFMPNRLELDQVSEFTVATSNSGATVGGGASQVMFVTPSGTNRYSGSAYWSNRNNSFAANDWFNNKDGIKSSFLNQNQLGGSIGGPIVKDKLLFYANYEAMRRRQSYNLQRTILTNESRNGIYTYRDLAGNIQKVNILSLAGVSADPYMQKLLEMVPTGDKINNYRTGDSRDGFLRNTGGYAFNSRYNTVRDNVTAKLDYNFSVQHVFSGTYAWNRDIVDRPTYGTDFSEVPKVRNEGPTKLFSIGWRWNPGPTLTNELRAGFNKSPALFATTQEFPEFLLGGLFYSYPINNFRAQGRQTDTYSIMDNASHMRGKHNIQFGFQSQMIRTAPFNDAGITPTYNLGISTANPNGLKAAQFPGGIGASDLNAANTMLATLAGYISNSTQTFNIKDRTSGFVPGQTNIRNFSLDNHAFYVQDTWKVTPRFTAVVGLRYEYYTRLDERDSLMLLPEMVNNNPIHTLLGNSTVNFAGKKAGRPWYNRDLNNFGPNIGLAYDVFGDGKTAIRAGYSISYVNDETITSIRNNVNTNSGLTQTATQANLTARVSSGRPAVPTPAYKVPLTFEDNYKVSTSSAAGLPDPNLRTPYVQQWTLGIQQEIKGTVFEVRYVGNKTTKAFRAFDFNQVVIKENGFLEDFQRAQNNGWLAKAATGTFNPNYNSSIAGSQQLKIFPLLGGSLTSAANLNYLQTGQVGEMASNYQITRNNGPINFFRNPWGLGMNYITNYSNASYNALQIEARKRMRQGLSLQGNYTWSKVLSDSLGDGQARFEPFLDMDNPKIERARAGFDLTQALKVNYVYDLPLGKGHRADYAPLRVLLSGWSTSGIFKWQSGSPFSVLSLRGTLNRTGRSTANTATTNLTGEQLKDVVGFFMTGDGPMFINESALNPRDGRGVSPDGEPFFSGQAFYNPAAGNVGALQRRMFSGPSVWNLDFGVQKQFQITERQSLEFRMDATNVFNHATFWVGDEALAPTPGQFNINDPNFGRISSTFYDRRIIQFGLRLRF